MSTFANLVTLLSGLSVSGVNRVYVYTPPAVAGDLPALFVGLPTGRGRTSTTRRKTLDRQIQLVLLLASENEGTEARNYAQGITLMDALAAALLALDDNAHWQGIPTFDIRLGGYELSNNAYWAVICTIQVQGL